MATSTSTLADRLREIVPADRVIDDPATLLPYAYDASFWSLRQQRLPDVVVVPRSTAEVASVVRFADSTATPVVPRGAGTGQTGGAIAARGGIVISFARMREIIEIDRRNLQAVVEPGIVFADLQDALRPHGLFFPPDPGSGRACTLGGMAANNASGPHAVRWGTTSAYVLGAEVVLADGSVITTGGVHSKALKSSSGIDLTKLFVGSEGTLGIITRLRTAISLKHCDSTAISGGIQLGLVRSRAGIVSETKLLQLSSSLFPGPCFRVYRRPSRPFGRKTKWVFKDANYFEFCHLLSGRASSWAGTNSAWRPRQRRRQRLLLHQRGRLSCMREGRKWKK